MGDIAATLDWAAGQLWANADKVGITGFCWGGKVVWQAAARFAAIDAGRRLVRPPGARRRPRRRNRSTAGRPWPVDLADDLKGAGARPLRRPGPGHPQRQRRGHARGPDRGRRRPSSAIIVYPDAPHGFHADYRASYRAADAADGWARLLALFEAKLK